MRLWSTIASTSGARIFSLLISLGILSVTAWELGPEGRGIIATTTTWVGLLATLTSLSLGQVALHRAATASGSAWLPPLLRNLTFVVIALTILCWLVLAAAWLVRPQLFGQLPTWALLMGLLAIPFYLWETYGSNLLIASGNLNFYNRRLIWFSGAGFVALCVVLFSFKGGVTAALFIVLANAAASSAAGFIKLKKLVGGGGPFDWADTWLLLKDGFKLHLNAVGGVMIIGMDVLMVNYYRSPADVGYYQLAAQLISAMLIIAASAGLVFNQLMARMGPDAMWPQQRRAIVAVMVLMVAAAGIVYLISPYLIEAFAGPQFAPSVDLVRVMLLSLPGMTLSLCMANQWLGRGFFFLTALTTLTSGLANLFLNLYLIPRFGAVGAAWATATVYSAGMAFNILMVFYVQRQASAMKERHLS